MVELKNNDMAQFVWFFPFPGDWHTMKLLSEIIRYLVWDGNFVQNAALRGSLSNDRTFISCY